MSLIILVCQSLAISYMRQYLSSPSLILPGGKNLRLTKSFSPEFDSLAYADPIYSTQAAATASAALQPHPQSSPAILTRAQRRTPFLPLWRHRGRRQAQLRPQGRNRRLHPAPDCFRYRPSRSRTPGLSLSVVSLPHPLSFSLSLSPAGPPFFFQTLKAKTLLSPSLRKSVLSTPWHTNNQIRPQVQGWVDPTRMILRHTLPYVSTTPSNQFRVVCASQYELHVELWQRIFVEDPYDVLGYRAHWIALLCQQVQGSGDEGCGEASLGLGEGFCLAMR